MTDDDIKAIEAQLDKASHWLAPEIIDNSRALIAEVRRLQNEVKDMADKGLDFACAVAEGRYKHGETYD